MRKTDINEINQLLSELKYCNQNRKKSKAEMILNTLLAKYPTDSKVMFEHALFLWHSGGEDNTKEALSILKELIDNNAKNKYSAMYEYVKISVYTRKIDDTLKDYLDELLKHSNLTKQVEYYYGKYYEKQCIYDMALYHYEKAEKLGLDKAKSAIINVNIKKGKGVRSLLYNNELRNSKRVEEVSLKVRYLLSENKQQEAYELTKKSELFLKKQYINDANIYFFFRSYIDLGKVDDSRRIYDIYKDDIVNEEMNYYFIARLELADEEYDKAKIYLNKIINIDREYVEDAYYFLARLAFYEGNIDLTEYYYKELYNYNKCNPSKMYLAYINYRKGEIDKAKEYLNDLSDEYIKLNAKSYRQMNTFLGLELSEDDLQYYSINQILNFDINKAIEHISKHKEEGVILFKEDIDIKELYDEISNEIVNLKPDSMDTLNHYFIKKEGIGIGEYDIYDYIEVVAVPNTNHIITMFPVPSNNVFAINYKKKKEEKIKIKELKRTSQIDKFYQKYGR